MALTFAQPEIEGLYIAARNRSLETAAVGFVWPARGGNKERFLVRELCEVPDTAYAERTAVSAVLTPQFCLEVANTARGQGCGVLFAHTHPGENSLKGFSNVDDQGESQLAPYFRRRVQGGTHFSAVVTRGNLLARQLGDSQAVQTVVIGSARAVGIAQIAISVPEYDRQIRAFGVDGQGELQALRVGIVGLGGTGSVVAQQLAHLGVRDFLLIDPDLIEQTNLNRVVGAARADVGLQKTIVASRNIRVINPAAKVEELARDVVDVDVANRLTEMDFIFSCTDSMASRAVVNQLAYQYFIPCIDVGVAVGVADAAIRYIAGRVQMLSPGLACLVCTDLLDGEQVRREMLTEELRKRDPYIVGAVIPQPAVISLNSTISSAAVTMFLAAVTGLPADARWLIYDGMRGNVRPTTMAAKSHCIVCSTDGAFGRGDAWKLPTRDSASHE